MAIVILMINQMIQTTPTDKQEGEKAVLASIAIEIDDIFFSLRKADQIIRRELNLLNRYKERAFKKHCINPINEEHLKKIINKIQPQHLLMDEYIAYMLENEKNSIFSLIREYNTYVDKRKHEQEYDNYMNLMKIDEKLVSYIRHLGAMTYHLNIHLNLLNVLLKNASSVSENQLKSIKDSKDAY